MSNRKAAVAGVAKVEDSPAVCTCWTCRRLAALHRNLNENLREIGAGHLVCVGVGKNSGSRPQNVFLNDGPNTGKASYVRASDGIHDPAYIGISAANHDKHEPTHSKDRKYEVVFTRITIIDGRKA